jgi:acetyl/propionyl-CoA carboxylase alpha subunit
MDSGVEQGWQVPAEYDPLLAKVLVVAPDRAAAIARAARAVAEFETGGVQTTLPFHAWLLSQPTFVEGRLRTDMVAREWDATPLVTAAAERAAEAVARFHALEARSDEPLTAGRLRRAGWKPEPWS